MKEKNKTLKYKIWNIENTHAISILIIVTFFRYLGYTTTDFILIIVGYILFSLLLNTLTELFIEKEEGEKR